MDDAGHDCSAVNAPCEIEECRHAIERRLTNLIGIVAE